MGGEKRNWNEIPLNDLTDEQSPITYGVVKPGNEGDVVFVRGGDIAAGRVHIHQLRTIGQDVSRQYRRTVLRGGEILVSLVGNPGQIAIAPPSLAGANIARQVGLVRLKPGVDVRFVSYFLQSHEGQTSLGAQSLGSVQQVINLRDLKTLRVPVPPLPEQKAIAAILGSLDDKIELNRRMNATLEEMARALFQSWFVDFDPVRAKLEGRKPVGLDEETAKLFPAEFQESELGPIPRGWRVCNLNSLTDYLSRGIGPSYVEEGGVYVLNQKCVRDHRLDYSKARRHDSTKKSIDGRTLQLYDILVNSTGMGTLGRVAQVDQLLGTTIVDSHVTIVRANSSTNPLFLGINLTGRETEIEELGEGSTGQTELSRTRLGELKVITPLPALQHAFGASVQPILRRVAENESQSRTLAALRDTLLPKLLSGELRVPDVGDFIDKKAGA